MADIFVKDTNAILDYNVDWTAWLNGDVIATSVWASPGLTQSNLSFTNTVTTLFLSGGTPGLTYKVRNRITTTLGRQDDETFDIQIRDH